MAVKTAIHNVVLERVFSSKKRYKDPFNQVELDVVFTGPGKKAWVVPGFWAGKNKWKVRFAPPEPGQYAYSTLCSDKGNQGLHHQNGAFKAVKYKGGNPLLKHGPLQVSKDKRLLEHRDGKPFLWLGDTWWLGTSKRAAWPSVFKEMTRDRKAKGFNIIQIVAGLPPDMDVFDRRAYNEGGYCWEKGFERINPAFFDHADKRIGHLVEEGIVPCILGCWGYYLLKMGTGRMKQHFRYMIARYAAYPVVWCLAGETIMPWYLTKDRKGDMKKLKAGWTEVMRYVKGTDPFSRLITTHTLFMTSARDQVTDHGLPDIDMFQASHGGYSSLGANIKLLKKTLKRKPVIPVVNGETCYEGIFGGSWEDVQRFLFWTNFLSGAAGYTYGANGVWSFETEKEPFGPSPHGACWNITPWRTAYRYTGGTQMGMGKKVLEKYPWHQCGPHPEWVSGGRFKGHLSPYCMGIPGRLRIIYIPSIVSNWGGHPQIKRLEKEVAYRAVAYDPRSGKKYRLGTVKGDKKGKWEIPVLAVMQDMVVVLEKVLPALNMRG